MPRNSAGNYSLPSGNPVAGGTAIQSSWANSTLADLANEVSNSLDRSGRGAMSAPLKLADGSVAAPGITFSSDPNNGLYRSAPDEWSASAGGVEVAKFTVNGVSFPQAAITIGGVTFIPTNYARLDGAAFTGSVSFANYPTVVGAARCAFYGRRDQDLPYQTSGSVVTFTSKEFDLSGSFNPAIGEFTAPAAGIYHFDGSTVISNTTGAATYARLGIVVNGAIGTLSASDVFAENLTLMDASTTATVAVSATLYLNIGDVVTLQSATGAGAATFSGTFYCYRAHFSGHRVV